MNRIASRLSKNDAAAQRYILALTLMLAIRATAQEAATAPQSASSQPDNALLPRRVVVVSIPDRQLAVTENGSVIATFAVAVGAAESPSPTGTFQIINRVSHPAYYHSGAVIRNGRNNPVGTRWVGLSLKGYGIHGTNAPRSIGHAASHGCIRLRNRDVERLFTLLRVGDAVEIHGERDEQVARVFGQTTELAEVLTQANAGEE